VVVLVCQLKPTPENLSGGETPTKPFLQLVGLLDLGQGVNGYPGTRHRRFFNVILDEIMGSIVNSYTASSRRLAFIAYLIVKFKKPLYAPQVVIVWGQIKKVERRKLFVEGRYKDRDGMAFVEADGLRVTMTADNKEGAITGKI
jgi:acyl-coenzyme A thioesterase THEM4